ncbi:hypothetical protein [Phycisphaera mikurensis]|uniref:Glycosyl hydrolase 36 catalytic domain-containing protein n=1 Tax=Phycisphaera mikurensis (strain NBRC 102666 / KCTC 22515 / FYK2301M01) TaxID=1142394 RepID=I0IIG4_PHYMF|nr:hypothetical protein [Phycisphaera mikurensis]MBB6442792.1 cellobiose phosphorylase [Phycisphaera mikurensis]BAM05052.1 hypothetical protein PSMK_28930 [Phycisphaera mikurensis NBRC 102666]
MQDFRTLASSDWPVHRLRGGGGLVAEVRATGGLARLNAGSLALSSEVASPLAAGGPRLWLRKTGEEAAVPLLGPGAEPTLAASDEAIRWSGDAGGFGYAVELRLDADAARWFWLVRVEADTPQDEAEVELLLLAGIGLADEGTLRNNEKYVSHYVDHAVLEHGRVGLVQLCRQALKQSTGFPQVLAGCVPSCVGVATDAVAAMGTRAKVATPDAGVRQWPEGANVCQHEAAAAVLRSCPLRVAPGRPGEATFFFELCPDHPQASSGEDLSRVDAIERAAAGARQKSRQKSADRRSGTPVLAAVRGFAAAPLAGDPASGEDLAAWFGPRDDWREIEELHGELASFFCGEATHVATRGKEARLRRGHGHLLRTGEGLMPGAELATATVFQRGAFGSHLTLGNTVFGRWSGVVRDELNLDPSTGLRIAVEDEGAPGGWRVLGVATAFATTPGTASWWYRFGPDVLRVWVAAAAEGPLLAYAAEWLAGEPRRLRVSLQVSPGPAENAAAVEVGVLDDGFAARPAGGSPLDAQGPAPGLLLRFAEGSAQTLGGDELLTGEERVGHPWLVAVLAAEAATAWTIELCNNLAETVDVSDEPADPDAFWLGLAARAGFDAGPDPRTRRLSEALPWLVHNAVIHLSTPVGLEQFTGGAWGTRDVCQGPVELLAGLGRHDVVAEILKIVFANQRRAGGGGVAAGGWPQWFMLPPYQDTRAGDAHGDVVVWPLKALADHLRAAGHAALLEEKVAWVDDDAASTLREHAEAAVGNIDAHRIPGTALMAYGHGDWNDALQPAEPWMAERMVSAWTNALLFETLLGLAVGCGDPAWKGRLEARADALAADFHRLLTPPGPDGEAEVMGVGIFDEAGESVEPLLHPAAVRSVVRHGLIAINRGILSGLLAGDAAARHLALLREHLLAPDGARLMDRPPAYRGGVSETFQRAESAAFFGREVGLMYTHSHLRYAEVLANVGRDAAGAEAGAGGVLAELLKVNPVGIADSVSHALPRQANAYFSSSDAAFAHREEADEHYAKVMAGEVPVEGGWRVYSSGPGIFVRLIVQELVGVAVAGSGEAAVLGLDPRLPADLAGPVELDLAARGLPVRVVVDPAVPAGTPPTAGGEPLAGAQRAGAGWALPVAALGGATEVVVGCGVAGGSGSPG